jgi:uncharacterized protein YerC
MRLTFPHYIFSEKEIRDFKRRERVVSLLIKGETWKSIKETTGAHLQTISTISKRLKGTGQKIPTAKGNRLLISKPVFVFGASEV